MVSIVRKERPTQTTTTFWGAVQEALFCLASEKTGEITREITNSWVNQPEAAYKG